jgi:hypothetical protein
MRGEPTADMLVAQLNEKAANMTTHLTRPSQTSLRGICSVKELFASKVRWGRLALA